MSGRPLHVCFVTANTFQFDARTQRAARALAEDGHRVTVVAFEGPDLPAEEVDAGVRIVRPPLDRRIGSAFRPLPGPVRAAVGRALGLEPDAIALPPRGRGTAERFRGPLRRAAEVLAYRRRIGPWADAVLEVAGDADVFSAKALVALPVVHQAAGTAGTRFVYDVADLHVDSGRLARMPGPVRAYLRRREREWVRDAAALTAATGPLADEVAHRDSVARPTVILNCRPRWRPSEHRPPVSTRLREAAGIPAGRPILLYQGAFREDQGVEELLPALDLPPLGDLDLAAVFLGFGRLEPRLRAAADARPGRIVILPEWTAGADVAFVGAPPKTANLRLTIPNKLFESLMAGVPPIVAGSTAVGRLVAQIGAGRVVEPWSSAAIAEALGAMLKAPARERQKARAVARAAALDRYNWETERAGLLSVYRALADRG
ncbi:MAG: glycosyltransferase family 4 protein [Chloroflexi bacterium]|nr:MAG: glycosyltransferase family 4 protein [Chloroflexota bacterium]